MSLFGVTTAVFSEDDAMLGWLAESLSPSYGVVAHGNDLPDHAEVVVEIREEPAPELPRAAAEAMPCFAHESELVSLAGWRIGERILLDDPTYELRISAGPNGVVLWRAGQQWRRGIVQRVIHAVTLARLLGDGRYLQLHASGLEAQGQTVAFAGPKGSGKTTTLARLASTLSTPVVANDRLILALSAPGLPVRGVPTVVPIRPDTLRLLREPFAGVVASPRYVSMTLAEFARSRGPEGPGADGVAAMLNTPQFAWQLGAPLSAGAPLGCLAVLSLDPGVDAFELSELTSSEAVRALRSFSFGAARTPEERTVFDRVFGRDVPPAQPAISAVQLESVRTVRLSVGPQLLSDPKAPAGLMQALFG